MTHEIAAHRGRGTPHDLQRELREALADLSSCQRVLYEGIQLAMDRGLAQEAASFRNLHDDVVSLECHVLDELARRRRRPVAGPLR